eukprot:jgi/Galph1/2487/GphlegSOOS_G1146.1
MTTVTSTSSLERYNNKGGSRTQHTLDLESLTLPDLLNGINPDLLEDMKVQTPSVLRALMDQERMVGDYPSTNESTDISSYLTTADNDTDVSGLYGGDSFLQCMDPSLNESSNRSSMSNDIFLDLYPQERFSSIFTSSSRYDGQNAGRAVFKDEGLEVLQNFRRFSVEEGAPARFDEERRKQPVAEPLNNTIFVNKNKRYSVEALSRQQKHRSVPTREKEDMISPQKRRGPNLHNNDLYADGDSDSGRTSNATSYTVPTEKKAMRAERNRQSAAASRERKKQHIRELERRVSLLSAENAQLQLEQLNTIKGRIEREKALIQESRRLKNEVKFQKEVISQQQSKIVELNTKLKGPSRGALEKRVTWTPSSGPDLLEL